MKLPVEIEKNIEISDPLYTFCEVMNHIDPKKYVKEQSNRMGHPRYDYDALHYFEKVTKIKPAYPLSDFGFVIFTSHNQTLMN